MEIASGKWFSVTEMEDPTFFPQYQMMNPIDYSFGDINFQSFSSSESYSSYPNIDLHQQISHNNNNITGSSPCINEASNDVVHEFDRRPPLKQLKTKQSWNSCITENIPPKASSSSSSNSLIISFGNSNSSPPVVSGQYYGLDYDVKPKIEVSKRVASLTRTPLHAQDHVIAERKRREKISQMFLSLSALIPGLSKRDKNSVLGDAIKYLKQLQERMVTLEEQAAKKTVESVKFMTKAQFYADDETSSSDENIDNQTNRPLPEVEARISDKDVLIRIHCEKNKGCISNIVDEVEKLHLFVVNSTVLPFGQAILDITIVAQMEADFSMTVKDVVKSLRQGLLKFM